MRSKPFRLLLVLAVAVSSMAAIPVSASEGASGGEGGGFLTGPAEGDPEDLAVAYVRDEAGSLGVTVTDLTELEVLSSHVSAQTGATHVNLIQQHDGLDVFGAVTTVTVAEDGSIAFVGGVAVSGLAGGAGGTAALEPSDAVAEAADGLELDEPEDLEVVQAAADGVEVLLTDGGISELPIPARLGWLPVDDELRLSWQVVIDDHSDDHLWNVSVDAETGEILEVEDWTIHHDHDQLESTLARGDLGHGHAHGTHDHDHGPESPAVVTHDPVMDGSSYRVFALPRESPNDGGRTLVTNPADAVASPFGWHDVSGTAAPDHTDTQGNNTHTYFDQDANNQPDPGFDVDGGPGLTFDFELDHDEHTQTYREAALTNLFYWCNVSHDVLHRVGFDEASGNFQVNNYGRGGVGGDDVRCEGADGGGTNNANMSTPAADGGRPRMQMYLWPGNQFGSQNVIEVGDASYPAGFARFSAAATNAGLEGVLHDGGNGCSAAAYGTVPDEPWIAIVSSGTCLNPVKGQQAQALGAAAVVVVSTNNTAGILTGTITLPTVEIPVVSIGLSNGDALRQEVGQAARVAKNPSHPAVRDGDLEAGIVLHEYAHGWSLRLTGGPGINCLGGSEQMGEGWSDYLGVVTLIDPALDDPEGPRGMGPYALFQPDRQGNGIRPRPYSRNMDIQPTTYDRIRTGGWITGGSLAAPHGVGHAWNAMLWDLTWDLIDRHGFNPNVYQDWSTGGNNLSLQLVSDGLKIQGCQPTFVRGRDAIITADLLTTGGENECLIWSTFARRGVGYSAVGGGNDRNDNTEAFDMPPQCAAPGAGFTGPQLKNAPVLNSREAGSTVPVDFNLGGDLGLDILKPAHSPASQQIDCVSREPLQYAITEPTDGPGATELRYNARLQRYTYLWQTQEDWVDTCRQLIVTLEDGRQHRANVRFRR
jgi:extracellular elastinolytic metalloproteinase